MSTKNLDYDILAYYYFTTIPDAAQEVEAHRQFFRNREITSRIYISESGINGQMSGLRKDAEAYIKWMQQNPLFRGIKFKISPYHENVFPKQIVKYRKKLVAIDEDIDLLITGEHASPEKWKSLMESKEKPLLLDIRNDYEWEVGRFEGAERPPCETFRDFSNYTTELKQRVDPQNTSVMMYCTGGIRCELYSSILLKEGFKKVYQLDGGVINYGMEQGTKHWLGKLFVFDDRMTAPIADEEAPVIGHCFNCNTPNESYYNCANMDCNSLYLCCPDCLEKFQGCCSPNCQTASRVRPFHEQDAHKPFRKWYHYFKDKKESSKE